MATAGSSSTAEAEAADGEGASSLGGGSSTSTSSRGAAKGLHVALPTRMLTPLQRQQQGSLLVTFLLESLCTVYEQNPVRSQRLFRALVRRLVRMKAIANVSLTGTANIRLAYREAFRALLSQAREAISEKDDSDDEDQDEGMTNGDSPTSPDAAGLMLSLLHQPEAAFSLSSYLRHSRYVTEFEELDVVGEGGFGCVFRARHRLDHNIYAIKKVHLKGGETAETVLREVTTLAQLDHAHVVRYHAAWLEEHQDSGKKLEVLRSDDELWSQEDSQSCEDQQQSQSCDPCLNAHDDSKENDSSSHQSDSTSESSRSSDDSPSRSARRQLAIANKAAVSRASTTDGIVFFAEESKGEAAADAWAGPSAANDLRLQRRLMLYIQMQLCEHSLYDWLRRHWSGGRPQTLFAPPSQPLPLAGSSAAGGKDSEDYVQALRLFRQLAEGVAYIHSKNLIHRDLKPKNLFLRRRLGSSGGWHLAIGDFGLARALPDSYDPANMSGSASTELAAAASLGALANSATTLSSGIGTETYAAPEQLKHKTYDHKVDIYSMGLVFFEMLSKFSTEMERLTQLRDLKCGVLPASFIARYPKESAFILCMTAYHARDRPSAKDILEGEEGFFGEELPRRVRLSSSCSDKEDHGVGSSDMSSPRPNTASQTCSETNSTSAHAAEIIEHQQAVIRRQEEEIERLRTLLAQAGITPPDIAS